LSSSFDPSQVFKISDQLFLLMSQCTECILVGNPFFRIMNLRRIEQLLALCAHVGAWEFVAANLVIVLLSSAVFFRWRLLYTLIA